MCCVYTCWCKYAAFGLLSAATARDLVCVEVLCVSGAVHGRLLNTNTFEHVICCHILRVQSALPPDANQHLQQRPGLARPHRA
jgi:hypothetical protein